MELHTPYELQLPADAVARVETAGVLGESFVQIDISKTSGPPLANGGVLKSQPSQSITAKQWVECLSNLAAHKPCDLSAKTDENHEAPERK